MAVSCFTISSCCSAQQHFSSPSAQPVHLCSHQRAFSGSFSVSSISSSSMWDSPFSNTHNKIWRRPSPSHPIISIAQPYLIPKLESAERTYKELSRKWRAAAEPQQKPKEEKLELPDFFEVDKDTNVLDILFESAQISKTARHYEVVFLVHEDHVDQLQDIIQKVKDFMEEKKGKIHRLNDWGMRKLAYKINKARRAYYVLMNIEIDAKEINDFKSLLDKDERIIRHLVMTMKKAETKDTVPPPEFSSIRDEYDSEEELEESEGEEEEEDDGDDQEVEEAKEGELTQV